MTSGRLNASSKASIHLLFRRENCADFRVILSTSWRIAASNLIKFERKIDACLRLRFMEHPYTANVIDILRNTLQRLEESTNPAPDDPAVHELKRHIVRSIAELEVIRDTHADLNSETSNPVLRAR